MKFARTRLLSAKGLAAFSGAAAVIVSGALAQNARPRADFPSRPVVVEMFLSQACNQSPPAAMLVEELAARPDIVALTWHVDYWDAFAAPGVGPWRDPFAKPDFSARQLAYNERLRGRAVKMTPQAVIDGVISAPGAKPDLLRTRITEAQFLDEMSRPTPPVIDISRDRETLSARIRNVGTPYDVSLVSFRKSAATKISGGDNAGLTFREANVVRAFAPLASNHSGEGAFAFAAPGKGLGCAVLVQETGGGRIVAARYCDN